MVLTVLSNFNLVSKSQTATSLNIGGGHGIELGPQAAGTVK